MLDVSQLVGLAGVPLIVAAVEACKRIIFFRDDSTWPFLAIFWGVALNEFLAWILKTDLAVAAVLGLVAGLAASGLYSHAGKAIKAKVQAD